MLHLVCSTGWTEFSCKEAHPCLVEGQLGDVGEMTMFLIRSISATFCSATGGADEPPPWSSEIPTSSLALSKDCCGRCTSCLFFLGEEAFRDLGLLASELAESWEPAVCLLWADWMSSSEKRTFFSEALGDEDSALPKVGGSSCKIAADTGGVDPLSSLNVVVFESWSFWSSASVSVSASSSSKNSSNVVSGV